MVQCDLCHGQNAGRGLAYGCEKCGGEGYVWIPDPLDRVAKKRTILGAFIWYGALAIGLGLLILWCLRGFK
jgi:hypothetical protein